MKNRKVILSTLWIFMSVNYIFCDVLSNMLPEFLKVLLEGGQLLGTPVNQEFLLVTAIIMEIPFIMIVLSRVLNYKINRWANIIAGSIMLSIQILSLFLGSPTLHYIFYSIIEIAASLFIIWYAFKWRNTENSPTYAD